MLKIAPDIDLPLEAVTQTFAIVAKRGSGKTYTAAVLAEEMIAAGERVVVLDPVGVWWGLRADAAGTKPGLPVVILGGEHGDMPLPSEAGAAIASLIVKTAGSFVLDVSSMSKTERRRFVADFAEQLFLENRAPLHVMLDEADSFAPQSPIHGDERMLGAIDTMVRQGRAHGIGVTLITQRPAVVNKNVLTQTEVLIAMRLTYPIDRKVIADWLSQGGVEVNGSADATQVTRELPGLPIGTAWIISPGWLNACKKIHIRPRRTFDSSATPKTGGRTATSVHLAPVDIEAVRTALASSLPHPAGKKRRAKADVARLATSGSEAALRPTLDETKVLRDENARLRVEVDRLRGHVASLEGRMAEIVELAGGPMRHGGEADEREKERLRSTARSKARAPASPFPPAPVPGVELQPGAPIVVRLDDPPSKTSGLSTEALGAFGTPPPRPPKADVEDPLKEGERWIITVLVRMRRPLTLEELATLTGFAARGGTFGDYRSRLARWELLYRSQDGRLSSTSHGEAYVRERLKIDAGPLKTQEITSQWQLKRGARSMLAVVLRHRTGITREQLGAEVGLESTGGTFGDYLSKLRCAGLITSDSEKRILPSPTLYLGETSS